MCNNLKWTDVEYPNWEVALGVPDRVNIPCLMHDTRLCQIDRVIVLTMSGEVSLLDYVTAIFIGLKPAHAVRCFIADKLSEGNV